MAKHKHYDAIVAFANGETIEYRVRDSTPWRATTTPSFNSGREYRVAEQPSPYEAIREASNAGKPLQFRKNGPGGEWIDAVGGNPYGYCSDETFCYPADCYRVKPPLMTTYQALDILDGTALSQFGRRIEVEIATCDGQFVAGTVKGIN